MDEDPNGTQRNYIHTPKDYVLGGKIMVSAIVILFTVVLLILCIHIYARCFLLRRRRNQLRRSRRRAAHIIFSGEQHQNPLSAPSQGLDASVISSLPAFNFSPKIHRNGLDCAVCLCEFEENEKGRRLPKCNHSFHIDCIDMWFHSHSTCPLCRAPVKPEISPEPVLEGAEEIIVTVDGGSSSEKVPDSKLCSSCRHVEETGSSSSGSSSCSGSSRRKALGFIEVSRRNETFRGLEEEFRSPMARSPSGSALKSPGGRIWSLKRILNRDRGGNLMSPCGSTAQIDLERGDEQAVEPQR